MGQTLSEPVTEKTFASGGDDCCIFGLSAMQGWRISMEDAHSAVLDLQAGGDDTPTNPAPPEKRLAFFGVYDGHGGDKVAQFAGENVHKIVAKQDAFKNGQMEQALKDGFLATDRAILNDPKYEEEVSGCTASVGVVSRETIWVANAGDSRSVLGVKGRAKPLSHDHKPSNEGEKARITAAGGFVDFGRVNGNLALSRAIGDFEFKKSADLAPEEQIVTAFPDVVAHSVSPDDEFLVIACDGIWDCQASQSVVEFVRRGIAEKQDLEKICMNMMDNCLAPNSDAGGVGCDNMTMAIIGLLNGKTKTEWYDMIAKRVADGDGPCGNVELAEFRGPGNRGQPTNPSDSDDAFSSEQWNKGYGDNIRGGRVILLGDGSEVFSDDTDDADMLDQSDEDRDSAHQVSRNRLPVSSTSITDPALHADPTSNLDESKRSQREDTPGPPETTSSPTSLRTSQSTSPTIKAASDKP